MLHFLAQVLGVLIRQRPVHAFSLILVFLFCGAALRAAPVMKDVVYSTEGGQKQRLDVYFPPDHVPTKSPLRAAVLCIHGGAWRSGGKSDMAVFAEALAQKGYVSVCISYRLFDPEKHPENVWPAQYDDAQRAVRWMRANAGQLWIDAGRIAAMGASAGGHLVALLGTTDTRAGLERPAYHGHSSRVNAVVDVFGPTDLTKDFTRLKLGSATVQSLVDDFVGSKKPAAEIAQARLAASPVRYVDAKTVPFLIFHGAKDTIVPVEQSRLLEAALKRNGTACTYIEWEAEGHGLGAPGSLASFVDETGRFLAKTIGKKTDSQPGK